MEQQATETQAILLPAAQPLSPVVNAVEPARAVRHVAKVHAREQRGDAGARRVFPRNGFRPRHRVGDVLAQRAFSLSVPSARSGRCCP